MAPPKQPAEDPEDGPGWAEYDRDRDYDDDGYDEPIGSCEWCGGTGWQPLNGSLLMECPECGGCG